MNVLIAYATNSGSTFTASQQVKKILEDKDHAVTLKKIVDTNPEELQSPDLIIFATPSWLVNKQDGMPHDQMWAFMEAHKDLQLNGKKVAVMGLGDRSYTKFCGAVDHLEPYVEQVGGKLALPSLRIDGYYFSEKNPQLVEEWASKVASINPSS
ncbi:hypothetical protein C4579_02430 [Candidatus Microgenomates bacterium]|nr:MAG: hypothetical protein C4579_02430 [Candidatus Microgenomates bacterium]